MYNFPNESVDSLVNLLLYIFNTSQATGIIGILDGFYSVSHELCIAAHKHTELVELTAPSAFTSCPECVNCLTRWADQNSTC